MPVRSSQRLSAGFRFACGSQSRPRASASGSTGMHAWLDDNCADGWDITPAGRCVVNDAIAVYFRDAALAAAFAARWCAPVASGIGNGFLRIREDEPVPRVPTPPHKTP